MLVAALGAIVSSRRALATMSAAGSRKVIDSAVHVWSNGQEPYPWAAAPPDDLKSAATFEELVKSAREAGVSGALIVQPANHKFDHSYVSAALKAHPQLFRGMLLANPTLPPAEAVAELERLHGEGYVGVRFNPYLFPDGMDSPVGRALYRRAGELKMPVGVMCFQGFMAQLPALQALIDASPDTPLILDHLGFFRQPATGGLKGDAASNDEEAWKALLALAARPQVHVKVSALFRTSAEPPPHLDLQPRVRELLAAYGASRLMWGSDFPFVLLGGQARNEYALDYKQAAAVPGFWRIPELDEEAHAQLMGGTAAKLFGFGA